MTDHVPNMVWKINGGVYFVDFPRHRSANPAENTKRTNRNDYSELLKQCFLIGDIHQHRVMTDDGTSLYR